MGQMRNGIEKSDVFKKKIFYIYMISKIDIITIDFSYLYDIISQSVFGVFWSLNMIWTRLGEI